MEYDLLIDCSESVGNRDKSKILLYKLTNKLLLPGCQWKKQDSQVRDKGLYYSWHSKQREHSIMSVLLAPAHPAEGFMWILCTQ